MNSLQSSAGRDDALNKFPRHCPQTLPQFLRPVLGAGSIISIEAGQGLILKAVTPSNFIQMSPLSLPLPALMARTNTAGHFPFRLSTR